MIQHLKERPANEPLLFMGSGSHQIEDGDWVYLETTTDDTVCVTVERTDRDPPNCCYEGRIRYFESELESGDNPLSHLGMTIGQMISFDEQYVFSCSHSTDNSMRSYAVSPAGSHGIGTSKTTASTAARRTVL